jgi:hypothetical protein
VSHQHPAHLTAHANLVSLDTALRHLATAMRRLAVAVRVYGDRGTVKAWAPATGPASVGGHGDPVGDAILNMATVTDHPFADRYRNSVATICWIAAKVLTPDQSPGQPPMRRLRDHLHELAPTTAAELAKWVEEENQTIRVALDMGPDLQHLPAVTCPACDQVSLAVRPNPGVVLCTNPTCICAGGNCWCGMYVLAVGRQHIWTTAQLGTWKVAA